MIRRSLRGQQRVQQQLAVLGARVAVAHVRVGEHQVVAVARGLARERRRRRARAGRRPGAAPSASAPACRSSGGRCGSSRASGRPCSRSASSARISGSASARAVAGGLVARRRRAAAAAPSAARPPVASVAVSASAASRQRLGPRRDGLRPVQRVDRGLQPVDELREPPGEVDRAAVDVVERQHAAEQPLLVLVHRHADQQPVQPDAPRPRGQRGELERRAVLGVQPPADAARRRPSPRSRAMSSSSSRKRRRTGSRLAKSITWRRGQPLTGQLEQRATTPRIGFVWRSERSASRTRRSGRRSSSSSSSSPRRAERGLDQRRERLDVRAHHDHVARLERRVLREPRAGSRRAAPRPGARGRGRRGPRCCRRRRPGVRDAILAHGGLQARELRARAVLDRVLVRDDRRRRARAAAHASPAPRRRAGGCAAT